MKIMSWNVRGLGGVEKRRKVKAAIQNYGPDLLVIQETKKEEVSCKMACWTLGFDPSEWCYILAIGTT